MKSERGNVPRHRRLLLLLHVTTIACLRECVRECLSSRQKYIISPLGS